VKRIIIFSGPGGPCQADLRKQKKPKRGKSGNYPFKRLQKSAFQVPARPKMQLNVSFFVTPITFLSFAEK
jgi:hypothetical protein